MVFGPRSKQLLAYLISPLTKVLVRKHWDPNTITVLGLLLNIAASVLFAFGRFLWGGVTVLVAGLCDLLDGEIARAADDDTNFGALLDSTLDRYSEIFVAFGLAVYFVRAEHLVTTAVLFFALAGSLMVSYVRARAEGLGEECLVGFLQRPERIVVIGVGGILGRLGVTVALWVIALLANYTVLERLLHVRRKARPAKADASEYVVQPPNPPDQ